MAKLHELLAVRDSAKGQAEKCRSDLMTTFDKKRHLFGEKLVTFRSSEEGKPPVVEEQLALNTTVPQELRWLAGIWGNYIDVAYQIAESNQGAYADVVLEDGTTLMEHVPVTALMELEKRAAEIHQLVSAVPTLDPSRGFAPDADRGAGVYRARDVEKTRTRKVQRPLVLYHATPEHPAQTQVISEDVPAGTVLEQEWSGLITPSQKAEMLDRAEKLRRAFKAAQGRANGTEAATARVAGRIFDYVFGK